MFLWSTTYSVRLRSSGLPAVRSRSKGLEVREYQFSPDEACLMTSPQVICFRSPTRSHSREQGVGALCFQSKKPTTACPHRSCSRGVAREVLEPQLRQKTLQSSGDFNPAKRAFLTASNSSGTARV